jgi:hypothetical protein
VLIMVFCHFDPIEPLSCTCLLTCTARAWLMTMLQLTFFSCSSCYATQCGLAQALQHCTASNVRATGNGRSDHGHYTNSVCGAPHGDGACSVVPCVCAHLVCCACIITCARCGVTGKCKCRRSLGVLQAVALGSDSLMQ